MNKTNLKSVIKLLTPVLPKQWKKVYLFAIISEDHYEISFWVQTNGKRYSCYDLENKFGITEDAVDEAFERIADIAVEKHMIKGRGFTAEITPDSVIRVEDILLDDYGFADWIKQF